MVSPCSATTSPSSQVLGFEASGAGVPSPPAPLPEGEGSRVFPALLAATRRAGDRTLAEDVGPNDFFRLLETIDLQRPFGLLRFAVQGGRGKRDFDRLAGGQPVACGRGAAVPAAGQETPAPPLLSAARRAV